MVSKINMLSIAMGLLLLCCGTDGQSTEDPCEGNQQAEMDTAHEADKEAKILYDELVEIAEDASETKSTIIQANFVNTSNFDINTDVMPFGDDCVGMLGRPTTTGETVPLTVESILIDSKSSGEYAIEEDEQGRYFIGLADDFFSEAGGERITATITSQNGDENFPPFAESILAPAPLVNVTAAVTSSGSLKTEWPEGDSTYIEIVLRTIDANDEAGENRIRCFYLKDDGCIDIPAAAIDWLNMEGAERLKVRMERHTLKIANPAENAIVEIDAMRSIEFVIEV